MCLELVQSNKIKKYDKNANTTAHVTLEQWSNYYTAAEVPEAWTARGIVLKKMLEQPACV